MCQDDVWSDPTPGGGARSLQSRVSAGSVPCLMFSKKDDYVIRLLAFENPRRTLFKSEKSENHQDFIVIAKGFSILTYISLCPAVC